MDAMDVCYISLLSAILLHASSAEQDVLRVVTILDPPYTMKKHNPSGSSTQFEGYIIDLVTELCERLDVKPEFYLVPDGKYGSASINGTWNGMVRELMDGKADIAASGLTISSLREMVIDFSHTFLSTRLQMLSKRPVKTMPGYFWMFYAFTPLVWITILSVTFGVWVLLYIFNRLDKDKSNPQLGKRWQHLNDFMAVFLLLVPAKTVTGKKMCIPSKVLLYSWFVFLVMTLILYITQVMHMSTALQTQEPAVLSFMDLVNSDKSAGAIAGGSTMSFFKYSKIQVYHEIFEKMAMEAPSTFVKTAQDAVTRVLQGNYVFIGESNTLNYMAARHCQLMVTGGNVAEGGYGLALPKGSHRLQDVNVALLWLKEVGRLDYLLNKWWFQGTAQCSRLADSPQTTGASTGYRVVDVHLFMTYGPLLFLAIGTCLALLVIFIQRMILCNSKKKASSGDEQLGISDVLAEKD